MIQADIVKKGVNRRKLRDEIEGTLFAIAPVLRFAIFSLIPLVVGLVMAFLHLEYSFDISDGVFCGLNNFKEVIEDPIFWKSVGNTFYFSLAWPISMVFALLISVVLSKKIKGKSFFRVTFFLPFVCSTVAITLIWRILLDYNYGVINNVIESIFGTRINWKGDPKWFMPGLILMAVWSSTGYKIILLTAALTSVNKSYYEAAQLDGANRWKQFTKITLPAISPTVFYLFITGMINVLQEFARSQVWHIDGGPAYSGLTVVFYLYREAFTYVNMGKASAVAWILSIIIVIITAINFILSDKWVSYD